MFGLRSLCLFLSSHFLCAVCFSLPAAFSFHAMCASLLTIPLQVICVMMPRRQLAREPALWAQPPGLQFSHCNCKRWSFCLTHLAMVPMQMPVFACCNCRKHSYGCGRVPFAGPCCSMLPDLCPSTQTVQTPCFLMHCSAGP